MNEANFSSTYFRQRFPSFQKVLSFSTLNFESISPAKIRQLIFKFYQFQILSYSTNSVKIVHWKKYSNPSMYSINNARRKLALKMIMYITFGVQK